MKNREAKLVLGTMAFVRQDNKTNKPIVEQYNALKIGMAALDVVETLYTLVDIHKQTGHSSRRTINMEQLKQVLDEYMVKEGEQNEA